MPEETREIKCHGKPLEFIAQEGQPWQTYVPETANCGECRSYFERKPNSVLAYKQKEDGTYACTNCGSTVKEVDVAHPIHDELSPMTGAGEVHKERVSYCPTCEADPTSVPKQPITVVRDLSFML